jgi:hypothetical protein
MCHEPKRLAVQAAAQASAKPINVKAKAIRNFKLRAMDKHIDAQTVS